MQACFQPAHPPVERAASLPPRIVEALTAPYDRTLHLLALALRPYPVEFTPCDGGLSVRACEPAASLGVNILEALARAAMGSTRFEEALVQRTAAAVTETTLKQSASVRLMGLTQPVTPLTLAQVAFLDVLLSDPHHLIFGVGPTGVGKTRLAVAAGLNLLAEGRVHQLVLTSPLADAEPGACAFSDELDALIGRAETERLTAEGALRVMPTRQLRGRTFSDCCIIVDDAQSLSAAALRMALTRLGPNSRMIVLGDPAQAEPQELERSGLAHALSILSGDDVAQVFSFVAEQIVRHPLVARIEALYESSDQPRIRAA